METKKSFRLVCLALPVILFAKVGEAGQSINDLVKCYSSLSSSSGRSLASLNEPLPGLLIMPGSGALKDRFLIFQTEASGVRSYAAKYDRTKVESHFAKLEQNRKAGIGPKFADKESGEIAIDGPVDFRIGIPVPGGKQKQIQLRIKDLEGFGNPFDATYSTAEPFNAPNIQSIRAYSEATPEIENQLKAKIQLVIAGGKYMPSIGESITTKAPPATQKQVNDVASALSLCASIPGLTEVANAEIKKLPSVPENDPKKKLILDR